MIIRLICIERYKGFKYRWFRQQGGLGQDGFRVQIFGMDGGTQRVWVEEGEGA